jgi:hypothetical protein
MERKVMVNCLLTTEARVVGEHQGDLSSIWLREK